jgi:hypothetical protein
VLKYQQKNGDKAASAAAAACGAASFARARRSAVAGNNIGKPNDARSRHQCAGFLARQIALRWRRRIVARLRKINGMTKKAVMTKRRANARQATSLGKCSLNSSWRAGARQQHFAIE